MIEMILVGTACIIGYALTLHLIYHHISDLHKYRAIFQLLKIPHNVSNSTLYSGYKYIYVGNHPYFKGTCIYFNKKGKLTKIYYDEFCHTPEKLKKICRN